jgi:dethiobiotin synthetase
MATGSRSVGASGMIPAMQGVFVTGTGTGVGKSIAAAALCAALVAQGRTVVASKPLLSGLDEAPGPWPHDHELLALVTGTPAEVIAPRRFGPPVSPHLAARLVGQSLSLGELVDDVRGRFETTDGPDPLAVVEGAGGLLVPIDDAGSTMADLAQGLGLPLLVVAHPGLGTINHVQLTLEAARTRGMAVAGVVLTPWPQAPSLIEQDNREFLERHTGVPVAALAPIAGPERELLAAAGLAAGLPDLLTTSA